MKNIPTKEAWQEALVERHGARLQSRLSQVKVVICGLGGLGSNIAINLARVGVGTLILVDFDKVDITNLHRQQYKPTQIGQNKTDALKYILQEIAPYTEVITHCVKLDTSNYREIVEGGDIICEAFDNADSKAMLVNSVLENFPQKYIVAASGMAGIAPANEIKTRRITQRFILCGDGESDVNEGLGLVAPRVALCAAHQALAVVRIIAGEKEF